LADLANVVNKDYGKKQLKVEKINKNSADLSIMNYPG